jgi:hypothetical protein
MISGGLRSIYALWHNETMWIHTYLTRAIVLFYGSFIAWYFHSALLFAICLIFGIPNLFLVPYYFAVGLMDSKKIKDALWPALFLPVISLIAMPACTSAVVKALFSDKTGEFVVTPKVMK